MNRSQISAALLCAVFAAAQALGGTLCSAQRVESASDFGVTRDCNQNGIDDALDIAGGGSSDDDCDGVPDECALR